MARDDLDREFDDSSLERVIGRNTTACPNILYRSLLPRGFDNPLVVEPLRKRSRDQGAILD